MGIHRGGGPIDRLEESAHFLAKGRFKSVAYWRGETDLTGVFWCAPLRVIGWCSIVLAISVMSSLLAPDRPKAISALVRFSEFLLITAAAFWWLWGAIQTSKRLLSSDALGSATFSYTVALGVACFAVGPLVVETCDTAQHMVQQLEQLKHNRQHAKASMEERPWTVVAQPELHRLIASGDIGWGSAKVLEAAIRTNPKLKLLELESLGGFVHEENLLIDLVRKHGLDTVVLGKCGSACTGVFLAGTRRFIGHVGWLGFHQSGYNGREQDTTWDIAEYETAIFMRERGVDSVFAEHALNTSYYGVWKPDALEIKRSGFATAWWSERPDEYR